MTAATVYAILYLDFLKVVFCNINNNDINNVDGPIQVTGATDVVENEKNKGYMGDKFPAKYLEAENIVPTNIDLDKYLNNLKKTITFWTSEPNDTDVNRAVGLYFSTAILKRTLRDYGSKFQKNQYDIIEDLIKTSENISSHYEYKIRPYGMEDLEFRVSQLFRDDTAQVYSIENFNRNQLKKWIRSELTVNDFLEQMDKATLPKEKYVELVETMTGYHIEIPISDECLSRVIYNPLPIDVTEMRACRRDPYCVQAISSSPSVAYSLSHRLVNLLLYRHTRRCYFESPEEDAKHMEILCAFMYREAVYIARKGYFARDLFLEHVAICGMLGYEEFFRRHWFHKVVSWMDRDGCIYEFDNFEINRTNYLISVTAADDIVELTRLHNRNRPILEAACHDHPMALLVIVLAHGIRHAIHYLPPVL